MRKYYFISLMAAVLAAGSLANAQVKGRFGFEYNEAQPWSHPKHELLLDKLAKAGEHGDINVNVLAGGWFGMQPNSSAPIDFTETDSIVNLFGRHGLSLAWNLLPNAPWAYPNKPDCQPDTILGIPIYTKHCAPEQSFEQRWIDYIKAVVERYDGDGVNDMPGLQRPVRTYIMTGEIEFGKTGRGDQEKGPFWYDSIDNLLHMHRITYAAIHEADPTGNSKLISSGALLFDLYADFPDFPDFDPIDPNSLIQRRLRGENYRGSTYTAGWNSLKKMLASFGDDEDGIECDYIGWHPHFGWRGIEQEFALIHSYVDNKPIYVDDMWSNLFAIGYAGVPFVGRGWEGGWINLTGTRDEDYFEKPQYHTYRLLAEKLHDFTAAAEIAVSADPRTRVYEFKRPRGPVYILWSETGEAPPNLDYSIATGDTVTLKVKNNASELTLTHIITDTMNTVPVVKKIAAQDGLVTIQLGYEPVFLEGDVLTDVHSRPQSTLPGGFALEQNYPNPFNPTTTIEFSLPKSSFVTLKIYNTLGEEVVTLAAEKLPAGIHQHVWDASGLASGVYVYKIEAGSFLQVKKALLLR